MPGKEFVNDEHVKTEFRWAMFMVKEAIEKLEEALDTLSAVQEKVHYDHRKQREVETRAPSQGGRVA